MTKSGRAFLLLDRANRVDLSDEALSTAGTRRRSKSGDGFTGLSLADDSREPLRYEVRKFD